MSKQVQILIVEDNEADVLLIKESFAQLPSAPIIHWVPDGEAAIAYLTQSGESNESDLPDLVLLDINLPRQSGLEVLQFIRKEEKLLHLPVVMLSTSETGRDVKKCYQYGANAYMAKPMDLDIFMSTIKTFGAFWLSTAILPES